MNILKSFCTKVKKVYKNPIPSLIKEKKKKDPNSKLFQTLGLSLIVCRNSEGKWLTIKETRNRGWWLPGGKVDPPESFYKAAIRECKEEAGIDIEIKGILRVEHDLDYEFQRLKIVFYAEPKDQSQIPKDYADSESEEAKWFSLSELSEMRKKMLFRGPELQLWAKYIEEGGPIFPLTLFKEEI